MACDKCTCENCSCGDKCMTDTCTCDCGCGCCKKKDQE